VDRHQTGPKGWWEEYEGEEAPGSHAVKKYPCLEPAGGRPRNRPPSPDCALLLSPTKDATTRTHEKALTKCFKEA